MCGLQAWLGPVERMQRWGAGQIPVRLHGNRGGWDAVSRNTIGVWRYYDVTVATESLAVYNDVILRISLFDLAVNYFCLTFFILFGLYEKFAENLIGQDCDWLGIFKLLGLMFATLKFVNRLKWVFYSWNTLLLINYLQIKS